MMKTSAKILAAVSACAMCAVMAGGAAYAIAPSMDQAEDQVAIEAADAQVAEAFSKAYDTSTALLNLSGVDADGNLVQIPSGSPAIVGAAQQAELTPMSLEVFGNTIPYVDAFEATAAPNTTAGLWMGSDSTTDGSFGYFVGHHPGVFNAVMYLSNGDTVTVCDRDGNEATYTVFAIYDVPSTTNWEDIEAEVTSHGESIVLQTCVGDGETYRIIEAA